VKENRRPVSPDNPCLTVEKNVSDGIVTMLDKYQSSRDHFDETLFFSIYENHWIKMLYPEASQKKKPGKEQEKKKEDAQIQKISSQPPSNHRKEALPKINNIPRLSNEGGKK
jgi:hypothetical protein